MYVYLEKYNYNNLFLEKIYMNFLVSIKDVMVKRIYFFTRIGGKHRVAPEIGRMFPSEGSRSGLPHVDK
jgi:hypothetical protein